MPPLSTSWSICPADPQAADPLHVLAVSDTVRNLWKMGVRFSAGPSAYIFCLDGVCGNRARISDLSDLRLPAVLIHQR